MCAEKNYFEQNGSLHEQSKAFLKKNGLPLEDKKLEDWLRKRGFTVEGGRIKFRDYEIEHALKLCPSVIQLKTDVSDLDLGGLKSYYGFTGISELFLKDNNAHTFHKEDGIDIFKLVDTSRIIDFSAYYPWFSSYRSQAEQLAFLLKHSNKSVVVLPGKCVNKTDLYESLQLISDYFEQKNEYQLAVPVEVYDDSAVTWRQIECLECVAGFHQVILLSIHSTIKENELITEEALCVRINAVALGYCCIIQKLFSGQAVIFTLSNQISRGYNDKEAVSVMSKSILGLTAQVWRYYQVPFMMSNLPLNAQIPNAVAGIEAMARYREMFDDLQSDIMNFSLGGLDHEKVFCLEKYLIDEEIIEMLARLYRGIDCSEEASCYDAVKNAGPRGSYFNTRMLKIIKKEFYDSRYLNKESLGNWRSETEQDLIGYVRKAVQKRLNAYVPPEVIKEKRMLLDKYLRDEDRCITQFQDIKF
ncbi:Trimethylamine:corrinoid methyltransferase [Eubacterium maltosivorans]|uniref:trimethylamine methyltransferase family protein n=1 Tax=Eubacterium TaxID=1730 RepID=UPI00088D42B9|nr:MULTISPECIES: trimethylamine methyltransferase family protein [Eubacterium]MDO5434205.1 trimethylamine methyltransferase family protein [Eubacterium sp.]WPK79996.1 hypothetical protein EUMA32_14060 [Eubacterium maltosivorans]SDP22182.1 Trimethylamine:corrinoid methyltransferase [Eubacterium maltosivorans]